MADNSSSNGNASKEGTTGKIPLSPILTINTQAVREQSFNEKSAISKPVSFKKSPVPLQERELNRQFQKVLRNLGYREDLQEKILRDTSPAQKYSFIKQYSTSQDSTAESPRREEDASKNIIEQFLNESDTTASASQIPIELLKRLKTVLSSCPHHLMTFFLNVRGGIAHLFNVLHATNSIKTPKDKSKIDEEKKIEVLLCIRAIISNQKGIQLFIDEKGTIKELILLFDTGSSLLKCQLLMILSILCMQSKKSYWIILEALNHFRLVKREKIRFEHILMSMRNGIHLEQLLLCSLVFLNSLLAASTRDVGARTTILEELEQQDINAIIEVIELKYFSKQAQESSKVKNAYPPAKNKTSRDEKITDELCVQIGFLKKNMDQKYNNSKTKDAYSNPEKLSQMIKSKLNGLPAEANYMNIMLNLYQAAIQHEKHNRSKISDGNKDISLASGKEIDIQSYNWEVLDRMIQRALSRANEGNSLKEERIVNSKTNSAEARLRSRSVIKKFHDGRVEMVSQNEIKLNDKVWILNKMIKQNDIREQVLKKMVQKYINAWKAGDLDKLEDDYQKSITPNSPNGTPNSEQFDYHKRRTKKIYEQPDYFILKLVRDFLLELDSKELKKEEEKKEDETKKDEKNETPEVFAPPPPPPPPMAPPPPPGGPPPPPGKGKLGAPSSAISGLPDLSKKMKKPKKKLRNIFWNTIQNRKIKDTVFYKYNIIDKVLDVDIESDELENMFENIVKETSDASASESKAVQVQTLLDPKRSYNISIIRKNFKLTNKEIAKAIEEMDDSKFSEEDLSRLVQICPTEEEIQKVTSFEGDVETLAEPDIFFLELKDINHISSIVENWDFKNQFSRLELSVKPDIELITQAIDDLLSCDKFMHILSIVLAIGNFLNAKKKIAYGFQMSFLPKLRDTKANDKKSTLIQYIVNLIDDKHPKLKTFHKELAAIEKAERVDVSKISLDLSEMKTGLKRLESFDIDGKSDELHKKFIDSMKQFKEDAELIVERLQEKYDYMNKQIKECAVLFGEDPKKLAKDPAPFFKNIHLFIGIYKESEKKIEEFKAKQLKTKENEVKYQRIKRSASSMRLLKAKRHQMTDAEIEEKLKSGQMFVQQNSVPVTPTDSFMSGDSVNDTSMTAGFSDADDQLSSKVADENKDETVKELSFNGDDDEEEYEAASNYLKEEDESTDEEEEDNDNIEDYSNRMLDVIDELSDSLSVFSDDGGSRIKDLEEMENHARNKYSLGEDLNREDYVVQVVSPSSSDSSEGSTDNEPSTTPKRRRSSHSPSASKRGSDLRVHVLKKETKKNP